MRYNTLFIIALFIFIPTQTMAVCFAFAWPNITPNKGHYVKCDGSRLNNEPIFIDANAQSGLYEFNAPEGFHGSCVIESCDSSNVCTDTSALEVFVATTIVYVVSPNPDSDTRPIVDADLLRTGIRKVLDGQRIATGSSCGAFIVKRGNYTYHEVPGGAAVCEAVK